MKLKHNYERTYTKKDIVKYISEGNKISISQANKWFNAVVEAIRYMLMKKEMEFRIEIRDFGVFEVKNMCSKPKARNPKTGEVIYVPPRRKTHFKPGKILRKFLSLSMNKYE